MRIRNEVQAGIFVVVGLALFAASIFIMGREKQLFARQISYYTTFKDVKGLSEGAPIRLGGISIGRVEQIEFSQDPNNSRIQVSLLVNQKYTSRIREDATISIETQGLLGDRFLNVSLGTSAQPITEGGNIPPKESGDIAEAFNDARAIVEKASQVMESLDQVVTEVKEETLPHLSTSLAQIAKFTQEVEHGKGILHDLVYSEKLSRDISSSVQGISDTMNEVKQGKGVVHSLIYSDKGEATLESIIKTVKSVGDAAQTLQLLGDAAVHGEGLLATLLFQKSPSGIEGILQDLKKASANFKEVSDALAEGKGTLGALLVDPSLYENLVEVTDDAKRSFLLRQAIKSSLKK